MSRAPQTPKQPSAPSGGSNEMFYTDDAGQKQDAELHAELLDTISDEDNAYIQRATRDRAVADGMDAELADRLYGTQPSDTSRFVEDGEGLQIEKGNSKQ